MVMEGREGRFTERVDLAGTDSRLKELVVYIASKCQDDPAFGAVKLNKILFHADFRSQRRRGRPITGVPYFRLQQGPAPRNMVPIMNELHQEEAVRTQRRLVGGREQKRPVALRLPNLERFDGLDIAIVDEVIEEQWGKSATAVSAESHGVQWRTRANQDPIPYEAAYLSDAPVTAYERVRAEELARDLHIKAA
jgi:Antitoxin SocA-like, Panacea domain